MYWKWLLSNIAKLNGIENEMEIVITDIIMVMFIINIMKVVMEINIM